MCQPYYHLLPSVLAPGTPIACLKEEIGKKYGMFSLHIDCKRNEWGSVPKNPFYGYILREPSVKPKLNLNV